MQSTGVILTSDYPVPGPGRHWFNEKPHTGFLETVVSAPDRQSGHLSGSGNIHALQRYRARSSHKTCWGLAVGKGSGMRSAGVISASVSPVTESRRHSPGEKQHHGFWKRPFQPGIGSLVCHTGPEISTHCNAPAGRARKGRLGGCIRGGRTSVMRNPDGELYRRRKLYEEMSPL
jgi:hypothetical protein